MIIRIYGHIRDLYYYWSLLLDCTIMFWASRLVVGVCVIGGTTVVINPDVSSTGAVRFGRAFYAVSYNNSSIKDLI